MKKAGRIGLVFGVFDSFHDGHKHFLNGAQEECDELYVAVAPDAVVESLKGKKPRQTIAERMQVLSAYDRSLNVVEGDAGIGTWKVLRNVKPDIVFLGYDQKEIAESLTEIGVHFRVLDAHEPGTYKSSLLG